MDNHNYLLRKISGILLIVSLLFIAFLTYANTVDDLDLWWHLKSGQLIFETRGIPQKDYFAYTTEVPESITIIGRDEVPPTELPSGYQSNALRGNWLSQLIFYLVYAAGGFVGIGILKSIVFVVAYLVLYLTMLRRGADHLISFLVLCLIAFIGIEFNLTRAQIFSFLFFPCVLYALYTFRNGGKSIYALPALMLIWANLHGGFILGNEMGLWSDVVKKSPQKARPHSLLGVSYSFDGQIDRTIAEIKKAISIEPHHLRYAALGNAYCEKGLPDLALVQYDKALSIKPDFYDIHVNSENISLQIRAYSTGR